MDADADSAKKCVDLAGNQYIECYKAHCNNEPKSKKERGHYFKVIKSSGFGHYGQTVKSIFDKHEALKEVIYAGHPFYPEETYLQHMEELRKKHRSALC